MSKSDRIPGPDGQNRPIEEPNESEEWQDDRWTIDYRDSPESIIASLHLQPGEPIPEWFEECPWCSGATCEECDRTGHIHPKRAMWFRHYLLDVQSDFNVFLTLLESGQVAPSRVYVAIVTLGPMMRQLLVNWRLEEGRIEEMADEIETTWRTPVS